MGRKETDTTSHLFLSLGIMGRQTAGLGPVQGSRLTLVLSRGEWFVYTDMFVSVFPRNYRMVPQEGDCRFSPHTRLCVCHH
jgi:hypothetical protein